MAIPIPNMVIRRACGSPAFERGMEYFQQGRVVSFEARETEGLAVVESSVEGRGGRLYDQHITLQLRGNQLFIDGKCTCPMDYNCKHVVAACLEYQTHSRPGRRRAAEWLASLRNPEKKTTALQPGSSCLFYVIEPDPDGRAPRLKLQIARIKKDGAPGVGRAAKGIVGGWGYIYAYNSSRCLQDHDRVILKMLEPLWEGDQQSLLEGKLGHAVLEEMLATGRCCLESPANRLHPVSGQRRLRLEWEREPRGFRMRARVEPEADLLGTEPPFWLDRATGEVGPLDVSSLGGMEWERLLAAPLLPVEELATFTAALLTDYADLPIPPPLPVEIEELEGRTPTPVLHLELREEGELPYRARLAFDYELCVCEREKASPVVVLQGDDGLLRLHRDLEAEENCAATLRQAGLAEVPRGCFQVKEGGAGVWREFLQETLPRLEREGWKVVRSEDFRPSFLDGSAVEAQVEEDEEGWFDLRFDLEIDGRKIPLLPLLLPLLQQYDRPDQLPGQLTVPLGEQRFLTLEADRLRPFIETVFELFDGEYDEASLRLSRFDAARLAELEEDARLQMKGAERLRRLGQRLRDFQGIETVAPPAGLQCRLRPYQQFGLSWLQFLREYDLGGILADDMGLGKTVQTLAHLLLEKEAGRLDKPALVVAPTSLMGNWRREAERFAPDLKVLVLHGPARHERFEAIPAHDLVLTTYPLLVRDEAQLKDQMWSFVILDEAQTVKNPRTKAARALRRLKSSYRLCLTGTPLENHLGELWSLFDFVMPGFLGSEEQFKRLYRTPVEKHGDEDCRRRLVRRIAPFLLRRTKAEVEKDLPAKTEIVRTVELYPNQAALYESIRVTMEAKVREAVAAKGLARSQIAILDALLKLRQVCCHPQLVKLSKARNLPSAKLDLLLQMLPELLEEGRRILLFSQFTGMLGLIEKELERKKIAYAKLTGQTRKRDEAIERFKSGEANLFLISLKAGGVGLNLTEADTVILYDPWWNPAVEAQAMDRAHRIGQDKPVFVYKLMTEHTVEERILKLQARKQALAEGIYGKGGKQGPALSAEDLKELFAPLG